MGVVARLVALVLVASLVAVVVWRDARRDATPAASMPLEVEQPLTSATTLLVLCCDALKAMRANATMVPSSGGAVYLWTESGGSTQACRAWFERRGHAVTLLDGDLGTLWEPLARETALVVVDSSSRAPLSTVAAHCALPVERLALSFIVVPWPSRASKASLDRPRVEALGVVGQQMQVLVAAFERVGMLRNSGWLQPAGELEPRWRAVWRSLLADGPPEDAAPAMVDWGSGEGYFSVRLGQLYPRGRVLAVDAEVDDEYRGVRARHAAHAERLGVSNNVHCRSQVHGREFERTLLAYDRCWDVQLSLGVMHEFEYFNHQSFLWRLGWLVLSARVTFLELPEARVYGAGARQPRWEQLNRWYGGVLDEQELIRRAVAHVQWWVGGYTKMRYRLTMLGSMLHAETQTTRSLIRVDVWHPPQRSMDWDKQMGFLMC